MTVITGGRPPCVPRRILFPVAAPKGGLAVGWLFRTLVRQQQRATAARGCLVLVVFIVFVVVGLVFILPLLLRFLPLVQTTHP